jgi:hypothetical protein
MTAERQGDRIFVRAGNRYLMFTEAEIDRLHAFARGQGQIQRHVLGADRYE